MANWSFHTDRESVIAEPHARPPMPASPGDTLLHLGLGCTSEARLALFGLLGIDPELKNDRHWKKDYGRFGLKLEQHTEFMSITLLAANDGKSAELTDLLNRIAAVEGAEAITLTRVEMAPEGTKPMPPARAFGGTMRGGMAVLSTLTPDPAGFIVYHVHARPGSPDETGRRVQRLIEMETYRTLCLLGLPLARRTGESLAGDERRLIEVVGAMGSESIEGDGTLFEHLSQLLQKSNAMRASTRFRFSASLAYYNLVQQRLTSLEEEKLDDLQTISGFVRSRLEPSMATIDSTAARQRTLIDDLSQALSLLRTRIDLALNRDNQTVLKSLDARNRKQVLIAQTVEGLSAVAISYYAVGLLSYVLKAAAPHIWPGMPQTTLIAISVPIVVAAVWITLHRLRGRWEKGA
ncbi:Uncharacterized membrane-anchored protein [Roseovarius nanhaiticus]|uniref:Uncharacterized membrane-anchored protein n=1 Tax=Roseovarius nanhaiticus TaxID=573024 RepID=A0A1N7HG73_9RHOB|nr:DUF3422 domain-containing protein [Roseovarius nanhaiticus]SEK96283.1 Uncharacterized membrane-anchored protein [Roseovarius nanhaiticus]SIS23894.1 Uncharacterized membrane-anchored protein [Roseovarius nanhaiticus]